MRLCSHRPPSTMLFRAATRRARARPRRDGHGLSRARPQARPPVALKVLHPELAARSAPNASFARSARRAAAASPHPPRARLGEPAAAALVRDALRGGRESARPPAARGQLPIEEAVGWSARWREALGYAHRQASFTATSSRRTSCSRRPRAGRRLRDRAGRPAGRGRRGGSPRPA